MCLRPAVPAARGRQAWRERGKGQGLRAGWLAGWLLLPSSSQQCTWGAAQATGQARQCRAAACSACSRGRGWEGAGGHAAGWPCRSSPPSVRARAPAALLPPPALPPGCPAPRPVPARGCLPARTGFFTCKHMQGKGLLYQMACIAIAAGWHCPLPWRRPLPPPRPWRKASGRS